MGSLIKGSLESDVGSTEVKSLVDLMGHSKYNYFNQSVGWGRTLLETFKTMFSLIGWCLVVQRILDEKMSATRPVQETYKVYRSLPKKKNFNTQKS